MSIQFVPKKKQVNLVVSGAPAKGLGYESITFHDVKVDEKESTVKETDDEVIMKYKVSVFGPVKFKKKKQ